MADYKEIFAIQRQWNSVAEWVRRGFDWRFLVYRLKWNYVAKVDHVLDFPLNVDIEVTDACNLKCIMCVHGTTGVPDTDMLDISFGKQMIDQALATLKDAQVKAMAEGMKRDQAREIAEFQKKASKN